MTKTSIGRRRNTAQDKQIGMRLREIRLARGMSQTDIANALGLTFQQVQKYENGSNAIPSSRVPALCETLKISATDLYGTNKTEPIPQLSAYAIRVARKIDKLDAQQKYLLNLMLRSFGIEAE